MIGDQGAPFVETDRRYWRNRSLNRRVRKARLIRTALRWAGIVIANGAIIGVLGLAGWSAARHLASSEHFAVRSIDIVGAERTAPEAVRRTLRGVLGSNILEIDIDEVAKAAGADPWVLDASVKRRLPDALRVTITERTPAVLAVIGGVVHVVDATGHVMGPAGPGLAFDLPVITGLAGVGADALPGVLARAVALARRLGDVAPALARDVSEIDLSLPERVTITTTTPGPRLVLDPERIERNVAVWLEIRDELARRVGAIEYADLRWDRRVTLKPAHDSNPVP